MFHLYPDRPDVRFIVYKRLLEIAGSAHVTNFIDTSLEQTRCYADEWALDVEQRRQLLRTLHNALLEDASADAAFQVRIVGVLLSIGVKNAKKVPNFLRVLAVAYNILLIDFLKYNMSERRIFLFCRS